MTRILITLASFSLILLIAAMVLGLTMGDLYTLPHPDSDIMRWATVHRLTGVAAALVVVFVESVVVTYFIGTSRWCREVVEVYKLNPTAVQTSYRLKRKTFPWAFLGMLTVVGVAALGAAADPATGRPNTLAWAEWHFLGGRLGHFVHRLDVHRRLGQHRGQPRHHRAVSGRSCPHPTRAWSGTARAASARGVIALS